MHLIKTNKELYITYFIYVYIVLAELTPILTTNILAQSERHIFTDSQAHHFTMVLYIKHLLTQETMNTSKHRRKVHPSHNEMIQIWMKVYSRFSIYRGPNIEHDVRKKGKALFTTVSTENLKEPLIATHRMMLRLRTALHVFKFSTNMSLYNPIGFWPWQC